MFPFAHVVNFFANKFTGLRGWRFAFLCIFTSTFYGLFFRHTAYKLLILNNSFLILTVDIRLRGLPSGKDRKAWTSHVASPILITRNRLLAPAIFCSELFSLAFRSSLQPAAGEHHLIRN